MAQNDEKEYILVEDKDSLLKSISDIKTNLAEEKLIAVDCEGVNLSRKGDLTVLSLATSSQIYIFDVIKLGMSLFDDDLREILEDKTVEKLMFDCRQDCDSLWHQFNVRLTGILDLQLLEVMYRRDENPSPVVSKYNRRSKNVDAVENIYGLKKCMELYVKEDEMVKGKESGLLLMSLSDVIWKTRPLTDDLLKYCCIDVKGLFSLYKSLKQNETYHDRLKVASERYADMYRSLNERKFDEFECNAYLPLDIIPEKGTLSLPLGTTECVKCHRLFPHEEFSHIQLRNGIQKCRVCKKIKLRKDIQRNRERDEEADAECYYSSGEDTYFTYLF